MRLWENCAQPHAPVHGAGLVYEEGSLIKRSVRDLYNKDIDENSVSGEEGLPRGEGLHAHADAHHAKGGAAYRTPRRSSPATASRRS